VILAVSGFVPIAGHPRPAEEYRKLADQLFDTGIPLLMMDGDLEMCWLYRHLCERKKKFTHSVADNPAKNSVAYHCVQAEKSEWLMTAVDVSRCHECWPDIFVWLDAGIFHVPGVTSQIILDFMRRAEAEQTIAIPGCWNRDYKYDDRYPCWRFCGGVWVVPRQYVAALDAAMKQEYKRHLALTDNLSWEVNTLARVEQRYPDLPIWHYQADHDASMFGNYQPVASRSAN
jgi:hypothetical protein